MKALQVLPLWENTFKLELHTVFVSVFGCLKKEKIGQECI